jgi:hypothetical protein
MSTGVLNANTRTATYTWFGGFKGGVQVAIVDDTGFVKAITPTQRYGVDGTWIGKSQQNVNWTYQFSQDEMKNVMYMQIFHFWADDPAENINKWIGGLKEIGPVITAFSSGAGTKGGTGK